MAGSDTYSNIVKLNRVKTKFALPDVEMPEQLFVMGKFTENNWEKAVPTAPINGATENHWRIAWIDQDGVSISPVKGEANWADDYITTTYSCKTAGFAVDETGKITADTEGWYTMIIESTCDNDKRTMKMDLQFPARRGMAHRHQHRESRGRHLSQGRRREGYCQLLLEREEVARGVHPVCEVRDTYRHEG